MPPPFPTAVLFRQYLMYICTHTHTHLVCNCLLLSSQISLISALSITSNYVFVCYLHMSLLYVCHVCVCATCVCVVQHYVCTMFAYTFHMYESCVCLCGSYFFNKASIHVCIHVVPVGVRVCVSLLRGNVYQVACMGKPNPKWGKQTPSPQEGFICPLVGISCDPIPFQSASYIFSEIYVKQLH